MAALAHVHLVIAEDDLRVDYFAAMGADAAGELVEDVIGIVLLRCWAAGWGWDGFWVGQADSPIPG